MYVALWGQKGDPQREARGTLCSAWHLDSPVCPGGSHADTQALQAGRGSEVSPCSLTSSQRSNSGWVTEGLVSR